MGKKINYTEEELLEILRKVYKETGSVSCDDFRNNEKYPSYGYYIKVFGTWNRAKELAGLSIHRQKRYKTSREDIIEQFKALAKELGHVPTIQDVENCKKLLSKYLIYNYFRDFEELVEICGYTKPTTKNGKYKKEFLISEIKRFVQEFGRVPIQKDFEGLEGYPSRKTFTNNFDGFNEVIKLAGFEPNSLTKEDKIKRTKERSKKETVAKWVNDFVDKYNKVPTRDELDEHLGFTVKDYVKKSYGTWNNCLKELGFSLNSVSKYEDTFLESEFRRFVEKNGRIPVYSEFNNSEYPSFWCYQNRFGSWNNAVLAYGYEPNDGNRKYCLDNGEICASSYEYIISNWLQERHIQYDRNIKYEEIDQCGYKGKMDCDYKIYYNDEIWYVEMAGFLSGTNFSKFSKAEKNYFFKLKYKKKLLKRNNLNYICIEPCDIKNKTFEEVFSKMLSQKQ